jgi:fructose-specific phosphotransferase system IIC component
MYLSPSIGVGLIAVEFGAIATIALIPSFIARYRKHHQRWAIAICNVLLTAAASMIFPVLGIVVWVGCLAWAVSAIKHA